MTSRLPLSKERCDYFIDHPANAGQDVIVGLALQASLACELEQELQSKNRLLAEAQSCAEPVFIIFDGPPGPEAGRFVEVETADGKGVGVGEWSQKGQYWQLGPLYAAPQRTAAAQDKLHEELKHCESVPSPAQSQRKPGAQRRARAHRVDLRKP